LEEGNNMDDDMLIYLQLLAENAPEGMIITNNDTIVYINPSACSMLNYESNGSLPTIMPTEEVLSGEKSKSFYFK